MLDQLLNCRKHPDHLHYKYLPVSTSYEEQLVKQANGVLRQNLRRSMPKVSNEQFFPNEATQNIKEDLIMLKLKGYIDQRDITGKGTEIKKLPSRVQVGTMIEGDPYLASKTRNKKTEDNLVDYFLKKDREAKFSRRKFSELQRLNQRKKKIKRKIIEKKQKSKNRKNNQ